MGTRPAARPRVGWAARRSRDRGGIRAPAGGRRSAPRRPDRAGGTAAPPADRGPALGRAGGHLPSFVEEGERRPRPAPRPAGGEQAEKGPGAARASSKRIDSGEIERGEIGGGEKAVEQLVPLGGGDPHGPLGLQQLDPPRSGVREGGHPRSGGTLGEQEPRVAERHRRRAGLQALLPPPERGGQPDAPLGRLRAPPARSPTAGRRPKRWGRPLSSPCRDGSGTGRWRRAGGGGSALSRRRSRRRPGPGRRSPARTTAGPPFRWRPG